MKTLMTTLVMACALACGATASAGVVVHAGPVHVGVGRPAVWHRPVVRSVVRPAVVAPARVVVPAPVLTPYQRYIRRQIIVDAIN